MIKSVNRYDMNDPIVSLFTEANLKAVVERRTIRFPKGYGVDIRLSCSLVRTTVRILEYEGNEIYELLSYCY